MAAAYVRASLELNPTKYSISSQGFYDLIVLTRLAVSTMTKQMSFVRSPKSKHRISVNHCDIDHCLRDCISYALDKLCHVTLNYELWTRENEQDIEFCAA